MPSHLVKRYVKEVVDAVRQDVPEGIKILGLSCVNKRDTVVEKISFQL